MRRVVRHCTFGLGALLMAVQAPAQSPTTVKQMLEAFAADYRLDPMAMSAEFGIKVGEQWWSVSVVRRQDAYANGRLTGHRSGPHEVILREGAPSLPARGGRSRARQRPPRRGGTTVRDVQHRASAPPRSRVTARVALPSRGGSAPQRQSASRMGRLVTAESAMSA